VALVEEVLVTIKHDQGELQVVKEQTRLVLVLFMDRTVVAELIILPVEVEEPGHRDHQAVMSTSIQVTVEVVKT
jgi:hypothetical protein